MDLRAIGEAALRSYYGDGYEDTSIPESDLEAAGKAVAAIFEAWLREQSSRTEGDTCEKVDMHCCDCIRANFGRALADELAAMAKKAGRE
ncbi:MAG: hypothetical protein V2A73_01915 [Pseudomonadota bacterium]